MDQVPSVTPAYRGGVHIDGTKTEKTEEGSGSGLGEEEIVEEEKGDKEGVVIIASSSASSPRGGEEEWRRRRHSMDSYSDDDDNPAAKQLSRKIENELVSSSKLENGRWSLAEHDRFLEGLERFGRRKWIRIAQHVGSRTVIQVRSHAQKYFKKLRKEDLLTEEYNSSPYLQTSTQQSHSAASALQNNNNANNNNWSSSSQQQQQHRFHHHQHLRQLVPSQPQQKHHRYPQAMPHSCAKPKKEDDHLDRAGLALLTAAADIVDKNRGQQKRQSGCRAKSPADDEEKTVNLDRDETSSAANSEDLAQQQQPPAYDHLGKQQQQQDCTRRRPFPDPANYATERRQRQRLVEQRPDAAVY